MMATSTTTTTMMAMMIMINSLATGSLATGNKFTCSNIYSCYLKRGLTILKHETCQHDGKKDSRK